MKIQNKNNNNIFKSKKAQRNHAYFNKELIQPTANLTNFNDISYKYGQENFEKSLITLTFNILFTAAIVYIYLNNLDDLNIFLYIITCSFDIILLTIYIYYIYQFKKDDIFTTLPSICFSVSDGLNIFNLFLKGISFLYIFLGGQIIFFLVFWFTFKFMFDIYFWMISLKIYVFCGCAAGISSFIYSVYSWIKYYILCVEPEENNNSDMEYSRMEDMESFY